MDRTRCLRSTIIKSKDLKVSKVKVETDSILEKCSSIHLITFTLRLCSKRRSLKLDIDLRFIVKSKKKAQRRLSLERIIAKTIIMSFRRKVKMRAMKMAMALMMITISNKAIMRMLEETADKGK